MALQQQIVTQNLAVGATTKIDPQQIEIGGKLLVLENCTLQTIKRASKRPGYLALPATILGGTSITAGDTIAPYSNELLLINGPTLYSFIEGAAAWQSKGNLVSTAVSGKSIARNTAVQTMADSATVTIGTQSITLYAWADSRGGVRASVLDDQTGAQLKSDVSINTSGAAPKCIGFATVALVVYRVASTIRCMIYSPQSNTFGSELTITSDIKGSGPFTLCPATPHYCVLCYENTTPTLTLGYLKSNGVKGGAAGDGLPVPITIAEDPSNAIGLVYDATANPALIYLAYSTATPALRGAVYRADLTALTAAKSLDATATACRNITGALTPGTANKAQWFYEFNNASTWKLLLETVTCTSTGTVGTPAVFKRGLGLAANAFVYGSLIYVPCTYDTVLNATYFLLDQNGNLAAKALPTQAGGKTNAQNGLATPRSYTGNFRWAVLSKNLLNSSSGTVSYVTGVWETQIDFANHSKDQLGQLGLNLHQAGGFVAAYDGQGVVEHGFNYPPENITSALAGGGSLTNATYGVAVVWEWADAQGQIHQSNCVPLTIAMGANTKITLTIPTYRLTQKTAGASTARAEVSIVVYRTAANGSTYYRDSSITSPTLNDPTADTVSYDITQSDATVAGNALLYNNANVSVIPAAGGPAAVPVLGDDAPPASSLIAIGKNRVFLKPSETPNQIWYSKQYAPGSGIRFSAFLTLNITQQDKGVPGDITGMAIMDAYLILFKPTGIVGLSGDGPDATGSNSSWSQPQTITTDVGCVNPNSIVLMPEGLMFQSQKGIYLLNRGLVVSYVGADVEGYNAQTIQQATLMPSVNQVRFLCASGVTLVYDYFMSQWSTFTNVVGQSSTIWNGTYCFLRSNGQVWQETPGLFSDNGEWISMRLRLAFLTAQINGLQRIWRAMVLGNYVSNHQLRINMAVDGQKHWSDQKIINATPIVNNTTWGSDASWGQNALWGGTGSNLEQFEYLPNIQKCMSMQLEFQDIQPPGSSMPSEGCSLSAVAFLVGVKRGLFKVPLNKRVA